MNLRLPAALLALGLLAACSTELDVNEPYKDITIVYGLLNQRDSLHFVKINKAFLGEGNALDMARVRDSSEYAGEDISQAVVYRINAGGAVVDSFPLRDTLITNRQPGAFYAPVQKLYCFTTPFAQVLPPGSLGVPMYLWQDDKYRLKLRVKGRDITATTPIANDFRIDPIDQDTVANAARVAFRSSTGTTYVDYELNWTSRADNKRFVVSWELEYDEVTGTDTVRRSITQNVGKELATAVNQDLAKRIQGEGFYATVASRIKAQPGWEAVNRRIFRRINFHIDVANDDLDTYLTLTEPITGIVTDRPAYSNIDGAIGVWGSRYGKSVRGKRLSTNSLEELINGPYTSDMRFCAPQDAFPCN